VIYVATATVPKRDYSIEALRSNIVGYAQATFVRLTYITLAQGVGVVFEKELELRLSESKTDDQKPVLGLVIQILDKHQAITKYQFLQRDLIIKRDGGEYKAFAREEENTSRKHTFLSDIDLASELYKYLRQNGQNEMPVPPVIKIFGKEIDYTPFVRL
jgi:hypothetical protein